jgi:hypothetical protein
MSYEPLPRRTKLPLQLVASVNAASAGVRLRTRGPCPLLPPPPELLRVRDAIVSRSDNMLSHLRLGRRRT